MDNRAMMDFNQSTPYDDMDYNALFQVCQNCQKCGLHETRTQVVFGHGPCPCPIMVIGEGPGEQEDLHGKPFIGKAGQLLTKIFSSVGIDREKDVYIANTVKCRPPNNRTPHSSEIEACKSYLIRQIQLVQPRILVLLGAPALKTILDDTLPISKTRGKWHKATVDYMADDLYIMSLFHPSYLLRNASKSVGSPKWLTWQDAKEIKAALDYYHQSLSYSK